MTGQPMRRILGKTIIGTLTLLNLAAAILFLLSCLSSRFDPGDYWVSGFLPLLIPYLSFALLLLLLSWLFIHPKRSLISAAAILLGAVALTRVIPFRASSEFNLEKESGSLRVMTWNLRHFAPFKNQYFDSEKDKQQEAIRREIDRFKPDVVCFQEFVNLPMTDGTDIIRKIMDEQGFKDVCFDGERLDMRKLKTGMAIFSKHPMIATGIVEYPESLEMTGERSLVADIRVGEDTVRFYSIHLKSFGFLPRDYGNFRRIRKPSEGGLESAMTLLGKMRETFRIHSQEARHMASVFASGPRLQVVCGDLNDVPASYAYSVIRAGRKDVHLEKGVGLGKTYTSPSSHAMGKLPTLRIDYIFTETAIETLQVTRGPALLSDHQAVVADIRLPQMR